MNIPDMSNGKSKLIEFKINLAIKNKVKVIRLLDISLDIEEDKHIINQLEAKGYKWRVANIQTGKHGNYRQLEITWN